MKPSGLHSRLNIAACDSRTRHLLKMAFFLLNEKLGLVFRSLRTCHFNSRTFKYFWLAPAKVSHENTILTKELVSCSFQQNYHQFSSVFETHLSSYTFARLGKVFWLCVNSSLSSVLPLEKLAWRSEYSKVFYWIRSHTVLHIEPGTK